MCFDSVPEGLGCNKCFETCRLELKTHVWEILGNPVNPAGVNLDVPFFPTCATPGDLSATISPQFFIEF